MKTKLLVLPAAGLALAALSQLRTAAPADSAEAAARERLELARLGVAVASREPVAAEFDWYGAPVGRRLRYRLNLAQDASLGVQAGALAGPARAALAVDGELWLTVAARDAEVAAVHVALVDAALRGCDDEPADPVAAELRAGFWWRVDRQGRCRGWQAHGLGARAQSLAAALLDSLALPLPEPLSAQWSSTARDGMGTYRADWQFAAADSTVQARADGRHATLTRCKRVYTEVHGGARAMPTGDAQAHFASRLGWFTAVALDERTAVEFPELGIAVQSRVQLSLALCAWEDGLAVSPPPVDRWSHPDARAAAAGLARAQLAAVQAARVADVDVTRQVAAITAALAAGPADGSRVFELLERLTWRLRLHDSAVAELAALLRGGHSAEVSVALAGALGAAGTASAQAALRGLVDDPVADPVLREAAAIGCGRVATPAVDLLAALAQVVARAPAMDGPGAAAVLTLGALVPAAADRSAAQQLLFDLEAPCRARGASDVWLEALGNAGLGAAVAAAHRYGTAAEEHVRAAAATAVRQVDDPTAVALLGRLADDDSPLTQARAARALGESPATAATAMLVALLAREPEPARRRLLFDGLGARVRRDATARVALERALQREVDSELRAHAQRLLSR